MRFYGVGSKSLWVDEVHSVLVSKTVSGLMEYCTDGHTPPLRYLIVWALQKLPATDFAIRFPAVLFGTLSIALMLWVGELLRDWRAGVVAAILLALSPWHLLHSQDARYYAIVVFLILLALGLSVRIVDDPRPRWRWIALAVVCAINLYISYTSFFGIAPIGAWLLIVAWRSRKVENGGGSTWFFLRGIGIAIVVGSLCMAPWVSAMIGFSARTVSRVSPEERSKPAVVEGEQSADAEEQPQPAARRVLLWRTRYDFNYANDYLMRLSLEQPFGKWLLLFLFLVGASSLAGDRRSLVLLVLLWFLLPWLIILIAGLAYFVPPRYLIHYLPMYNLIAAVGAIALWDWVTRSLAAGYETKPGRQIERYAAYGAAALIVLAALLGYVRDDVRYYRTEKQDWRTAVRYLDENVEPTDALLTGVFWTDRAVQYYLLRYRNPLKPPLNLIPHCTQADKIELAMKSFPRTWYVTWGPVQPDDVRAILAERFELLTVYPGSQGDIFIYRNRQQQGGSDG